jgi:hypothetical protein
VWLLLLGEVRYLAGIRLGGIDGAPPQWVGGVAGRRAEGVVRNVPAARVVERHQVGVGGRAPWEPGRWSVELGDDDRVP